MDKKGKIIRRITLSYGLIVILANFCGVLLPNVFKKNEMVMGNIDEWLRFLSDYRLQTEIPQYLVFAVPTILCIIYIYSKKSLESKIINCPIMYSALGTSGWIVYGIEEIIFITIALNLGYDLNVKAILYSSFVNIAMELIVTFTLSYFITETINNKFVLPVFFPEGHLYKIKGVIHPSFLFLFIVNYFSVTLFPLIFLFVAYFTTIVAVGQTMETGVLIMLLVIIIIGLIITFTFINYFDRPIKKLTERINMIKNGDYKTKVSIVVNNSLGELSDTINDMAESIEEKTQKIIDNQYSTIRNMAVMLASRDNTTGSHVINSSNCVAVFIEELKKYPEYSNYSDDYWNKLIYAAYLHDIGKNAVSDAVLKKEGKFTDEEYEEMKKHSAEGARLVLEIFKDIDDEELKTLCVNVAHYHHEKWNGQGYPEKISGEKIPFEARIMALADVLDALVSKRQYKEGFGFDKSFGIIEESLGSHFDPKLGSIFIKCRPQLESLYKNNN
ncbi:MAG: HD domain-containing protein [Treponema sp.]|nr:HD domain-containing protein [Treponema sp.]